LLDEEAVMLVSHADIQGAIYISAMESYETLFNINNVNALKAEIVNKEIR
jgi:hypothetical protein